MLWVGEGRVSLSPAEENVTRTLTYEQELRRKELCICNQRDQCTIDSFTCLGEFMDLNCLAQILPVEKILSSSPKGGLLTGCSKDSLGLNLGPRWLG